MGPVDVADSAVVLPSLETLSAFFHMPSPRLLLETPT